MPEVHFDYAFCRRQEEDAVATLLVLKHCQSCVARCWAAPPEGGAGDCGGGECRVWHQGVRHYGGRGVILKSDNEDAINALRHRVRALHPGAALEQLPAAYEHESNGVTENVNKLGNGLLRVRFACTGGTRQRAYPMLASSLCVVD